MTYLETRLTESNYVLSSKINLNNIKFFFKEYDFDHYGMDKIVARLEDDKSKFLNSHDTDSLGIIDQVDKYDMEIKNMAVPYPSNLLTALIFLRRISYQFMIDNNLYSIQKDGTPIFLGGEIIPVMIEGLFIDYIYKADTKEMLDAYYHRGYKKELLDLCWQKNSVQHGNYSTAYELQDIFVNYYKHNKKDFYKTLENYKKGKYAFNDIVQRAKEKGRESNQKTLFKRK